MVLTIQTNRIILFKDLCENEIDEPVPLLAHPLEPFEYGHELVLVYLCRCQEVCQRVDYHEVALCVPV